MEELSKYGVDDKKDIDLPFDGKSYTASIWYCGIGPGIDIKNPGSGLYLKDLCVDGLYFKIGESLVTISSSIEGASIQTTSKTNSIQGISAGAEDLSKSDILPNCHFFSGSGPGEGSIMGCVAQTAYGVYWVANWVASLMGNLFDFFLGYSLDSGSYGSDNSSFITEGWKVVRDISNIFFIIILVWTGFTTALGVGSIEILKKVVPTLIINALLINFSLFGTKLIIDLSNITARVFYTSMQVCDGGCIKVDGKITNPKNGDRSKGGTGYTPLSEKIVSSFNPQQIFDPTVLDVKNISDSTGKNVSKAGTSTNVALLNSNTYATYFLIISIIATMIMVLLIIMFWQMAFIFLGRVIGLYIGMIFSPFAVMTRGDMPLIGNIGTLKFKDWWTELGKNATVAPIFVFFLYVIYKFIDSDFLKIFDTTLNASFFSVIISISIPMLIVFFMLKKGGDMAKKLSGEIGTMISGAITKVAGVGAGLALGAATGGTALLGGRVLGGGATALNNSRVGERLRDTAANGNWLTRNLARASLGGIDKASKGSYDVRQSALGKTLDQNIFSKVGVNLDQKGLNALSGIGIGLGTDQRKGGFEADTKRRQENQKKNFDMLDSKMSKGDIQKFNDEKREEAMIKANDKKTVDNWKKTDPARYEEEKKKVNYTDKTAKEITGDRKKSYAKKLEEGGVITQGLKYIDSNGGKFGRVTSGFLGSTVGAALGEGVRVTGDNKISKEITEGMDKLKKKEDLEKSLNKKLEEKIVELEKEMLKTEEEIDNIIKIEKSDVFATLNQEEIAVKIKEIKDDENKLKKLIQDHKSRFSSELDLAKSNFEKANFEYNKDGGKNQNATTKANFQKASLEMHKLENRVDEAKNILKDYKDAITSHENAREKLIRSNERLEKKDEKPKTEEKPKEPSK